MTEKIKKILFEAVEKCTTKNRTSWYSVAEIMGKHGFNYTPEQWRSKYRCCAKTSHKSSVATQNNAQEITTEQILATLKTKRTSQQDAEILHMSIDEFIESVNKLKAQGYNIAEANHLIWLETSALASNTEIIEPYNGETEIIFGVISDTHLCNKRQQLTYLNDFYDRCAKLGISTIYHCGDISDGFYKNRPDHIYELFKVGFDEQANYIIENYPYRPGIITKFITGNHDATHIKNGGADIGMRIAEHRPDMQYLGYMSAKIWLTPQCDMDLFHPLDGNSYALSYQLQKHIDGLQGGTKPRILCVGHWHKQFQMFYRNIHAFSVPCFEAQTIFEKGKHINAVVGGWILKIKCKKDGIVSEITSTFVPYYDMIPNDWRAA